MQCIILMGPLVRKGLTGRSALSVLATGVVGYKWAAGRPRALLGEGVMYDSRMDYLPRAAWEAGWL